MGFTTGTLNDFVNAICNAQAFAVATIHVSLHTADPGSNGANEVTGGSYARQVVTCGAAASKQIANSAAMNFAGMPAVTVTHLGIWEGSTFRGGGALTAPRTYGAGDTATIGIGQFVATLTGSAYSSAAANALLDALFRNISYSVTNPYLSLHTGAPGDNGANEVTGGTYARQLASFAAASAGAAPTDTIEEFTGMPVATVSHGGLWTAVTGGVFLGGTSLAESKTFAAGDVARYNSGAFIVGSL